MVGETGQGPIIPDAGKTRRPRVPRASQKPTESPAPIVASEQSQDESLKKIQGELERAHRDLIDWHEYLIRFVQNAT